MKKFVFFFLIAFFSCYVAATPVTANLKMWLKADSIVANNGDYISQWNDLSGNNNHVIAAGSSTRPVFTANSSLMNNRSAVSFAGGDDGLWCSSSLDFDFTAATIFVVRSAGSSGSVLAIAQVGTTYNNEFLLAYGNPRLYHHTAGGVYYYLDHQANPTNSFVQTAVMGTAPTDSTLYVNSVASTLGQSNSNGGSVQNFSAVNRFVTIGNRGPSGYGGGFVGDISEVLIYEGKLNSTDRYNVELYLGAKYGIESYPVPEASSIIMVLAGVFLAYMLKFRY
ncbi:MAG: hypothetical protein HUU50_12505 [Candidatus Brocadiae bacterium]|nr:hypothetical protein [Candidatus Brocadiia bacterium]